jgi:hypothetical protein
VPPNLANGSDGKGRRPLFIIFAWLPRRASTDLAKDERCFEQRPIADGKIATDDAAIAIDQAVLETPVEALRKRPRSRRGIRQRRHASICPVRAAGAPVRQVVLESICDHNEHAPRRAAPCHRGPTGIERRRRHPFISPPWSKKESLCGAP